MSVNLEGCDRISFFYSNCNFRKVVYFESFRLACNGDVFTGNNVLERGVALTLGKICADIRFESGKLYASKRSSNTSFFVLIIAPK